MPDIAFPRKAEVLFRPMRYKALRGGRGSAKSRSVAQALVILASTTKHRILCCREIQDSIKESSHRLLSDTIEAKGLGSIFDVTERAIRCKTTGSEFIFAGLFRNVNQIKSLEGVTICWVEEAEKVSEESWDILTPTIREPGSEIWVTFNPQFEDDPTYKRFVTSPPPNCYSVEMNFADNPWFPEVLRVEMEQDKARDFTLYQQKWLGLPKGAGRKVWTGFDKDALLAEEPIERIRDVGRCYMAMDPHSKYYPFCVWIAILPKNGRGRWPEDYRKHVYAEWPTFEALGGYYHDLRHKLFYNGSLSDMSREIQVAEGASMGVTMRGRYIDTRFAKGAGGANWSTSTEGVVGQFAKRENGGMLFTMPPERIIDVQREVIHSDMLWNRHAERNAFNEPSFSVDPRCQNLIASLMNHRLEEDSQRESEKYKDASDALRICYAGIAAAGGVTKEASMDGALSQFRPRIKFV